MSELVGLGGADADERWLGIARHQAVLVFGGAAMVGDWLVRTGSAIEELVVGLVLLGVAVRCVRGLTGCEVLLLTVLYVLRPRTQRLSASRQGPVVTLYARAQSSFRGYELEHRGRLDLSGADIVHARELAELMNGLAVGTGSSHVSVHVGKYEGQARSFLALSPQVNVCEGWRSIDDVLDRVIGFDVQANGSVLERWGYLRTSQGLRRVIRVTDFQGASNERALLERLQAVALNIDLAVHVEVVSAARAQRLSARAVHRVGSDAQVSRAAGFRRSARAALFAERLAQREQLVASGQALLRLAVFVTLRAGDLGELRRASRELERRAVESGLRIDTGFARQWLWFCFQLPGGPGW